MPRPRRSSAPLRILASALVLAVMAACGTGSPPPLPLPPDPLPVSGDYPQLGSQFHGLWSGYSAARRAQVLDTLKANNVTSIRIDVSWNMLQPDGPGPLNPWGAGRIDEVIKEASSRGLEPLVTFWMAPSWANGSTDERVPPTSSEGLAGLTAVTKRLAKKYRRVVRAWEIWNEPNHGGFFRGADPAQYAAVLTAAYRGVKAGNPKALVVMAGTAYTDVDWIRRALDAGAEGHFDIMGVHPYPGLADEPPDTPDDGTMWHFTHVLELRRLMLERGDGDKPIWVTEWCYRAGVNAPDTPNHRRKLPVDQQVSYALQALEMMRTKYPFITRAYWYKDRAYSNDINDTENGLVMPNGNPALVLSEMGNLYRQTQAARR